MDNFRKVQCPHCQALYKCPVEQFYNSNHSAQCVRCHQVFAMDKNSSSLYSDTSDKLSSADNIVPLKSGTVVSKKNYEEDVDVIEVDWITNTIEDNASDSSAVSVLAYDNDDNDDWLESLFADDNAQTNSSSTATETQFSSSIKTPITSKLKKAYFKETKTDIEPDQINLSQNKPNNTTQLEKNSANDTAVKLDQSNKKTDKIISKNTANSSPVVSQTANQQPTNQQKAKTNNQTSAAAINSPVNAITTSAIKQSVAVSSIENLSIPSATASSYSPISQENVASQIIAPSPKPQIATDKRAVYAFLFWTFGCVTLLLLLLAQYVIFNLDDLVKNPSTQSKLDVFCRAVSCSLPGADVKTLAVANITQRSSTLQEGGTDILATLVNINENEQLYPNLHVRLYHNNTLLGEFIATPNDYLSAPQRLISRKQVKLFMLTVNVPSNEITKISITPLY